MATRWVAKSMRQHGIGGQNRYALDLPGRRPQIPFITTDDDRDRRYLLTVLHGKMHREENDYEVVGYVVSFFGGIFPDMRGSLVSGLTRAGYALDKIQFLNDFRFDNLNRATIGVYTWHRILAIFAQLAFMPFKNFDEHNYGKYMENRTKEIGSIVGLRPEDIGVPMLLERAIAVRRIMGPLISIKRSLKQHLDTSKIENTDVLGEVAGYVLRIISWTDMTAYKFILNTLIRTVSPVLFHPDLYREVEDFLTAMKEVSNSIYPQFFKIFSEPATAALVERNDSPYCLVLQLRLQR